MITKALIGIVAAALTSVLFLGAAAGGAMLVTGDTSPCIGTAPTGTVETSPTSGQPPTSPTADTSQIDGCADGPAALARAARWLTAWNGGPVPYLSSTDPATWFNGYRRDCSGYASMALGLPGPGLNTALLAARSNPLQQTELRPGDLLINPADGPAGHVVIFEQWANPAMTSYVGYEQSGDAGTHHRLIPYPYFGAYSMSPYHFQGAPTGALQR